MSDIPKSLEQISHEMADKIYKQRTQILNDFYQAYAAQLSHLGTIDLQDICVVEQIGPYPIGGKWWFEHKPKFKD